jgi:formate hydrogenlyase subunit 3/multisubunit Na+/H+ antiporter MnhD subunit
MINSHVNILIQWDSLIVEMLLLAAIIWFAVYLEQWTYRRSEKQKEDKARKYLIIFIDND